VAIVQSNYIPWKGYFDLIASVDEFVLFDDVQYTRRDWRNRNKIKTKDGLRWLTVPVEVKGKYFQAIDETRTTGDEWIEEHLAGLHHTYARCRHFKTEWEWIEPLYRSLSGTEHLSVINRRLIEAVCARLSIPTPLRSSRDVPHGDGKNERLIDICLALNAGAYVSGPAARPYIDATLWQKNGVAVFFKSYDGYPIYEQLHGPFEHGVTVLDLLFHTGPDAPHFIRSSPDVVPA
jgi:hypothetical protein